jgi:hypothetical protein
MKLDRARKITTVAGLAPLRYLQDGHGFDGAERHLGRFTAQGDPLDAKAEQKPEAKAPEGPVTLEEMSVKDLKVMAKEAEIEGAANMNKAALVEALTAATEPVGNDEGEGAA